MSDDDNSVKLYTFNTMYNLSILYKSLILTLERYQGKFFSKMPKT